MSEVKRLLETRREYEELLEAAREAADAMWEAWKLLVDLGPRGPEDAGYRYAGGNLVHAAWRLERKLPRDATDGPLTATEVMMKLGGEFTRNRANMVNTFTCPHCGGTGEDPEALKDLNISVPCPYCDGPCDG